MKRFALTAIGNDRPGIVAGVTKALFEHNCNIEDSSATRLEDEFAIILIMTMPDGGDAGSLGKALKKLEKDTGLTIHLKEIPPRKKQAVPQSNYIITLHGGDKAGIVYSTAEALSRLGVNITDLQTTVAGAEKKIYIMLLEVYCPPEVGLKNLEGEMEKVSKSLGVTIKVKPIEDYEPL